jgi:hypothetical protein
VLILRALHPDAHGVEPGRSCTADRFGSEPYAWNVQITGSSRNHDAEIDAAIGDASERLDADCALLQRLSIAGGSLLSFAWR